MNSNFSQLFKLIHLPERRILGLMSGTSADGLNIALCKIQGSGIHTQMELLHFISLPYSAEFRAKILEIRSQKMVNLENLCKLHAEIAQIHAQLIEKALKTWNITASQIDAIASHGQTVFHAPHPPLNSTLQLGEADLLAVKLQKIVVSDFRQKHIAKGGEGAPLALYGDYLLYHSPAENRVLLNLGGIANFTWLPQNGAGKEIFASDTGPANTLIDTFCAIYFHQKQDENGAIARSGKLNQAFLARLMQHPYFELGNPKSTGQELFNADYVRKAMQDIVLSPQDILCTLSHFTAQSIAQSLHQLPSSHYTLYASGGGVFNSFLMELLATYLQKEVHLTDDLGILADAKEAVLFAILANEMLVGEPLALGNMAALQMGKISFPE